MESLLIRLAASETVSKQVADARIAKVLEQVGRHPVLVLTMRPNAGVWRETPVGVTVLRVDRSHRNPEQSRSSRPLASVGKVSSAEGG